jgi:hypothetical protein
MMIDRKKIIEKSLIKKRDSGKKRVIQDFMDIRRRILDDSYVRSHSERKIRSCLQKYFRYVQETDWRIVKDHRAANEYLKKEPDLVSKIFIYFVSSRSTPTVVIRKRVVDFLSTID